MPQLVWCLGLIAVTMPCHYCATFIGCQWDSDLSSELLSLFRSVSMALLQSTCKSYALKWTASVSVVVPDYGLRQLAASSYQECKRLLHHRALLTIGQQCGTVCQQHCETVACQLSLHIQAPTENVLICSMMNTIRHYFGTVLQVWCYYNLFIRLLTYLLILMSYLTSCLWMMQT